MGLKVAGLASATHSSSYAPVPAGLQLSRDGLSHEMAVPLECCKYTLGLVAVWEAGST